MRVEKEISISLIEVDAYPLNPSTLQLVDFMRSGGDIPPIKVVMRENGTYKVKDGRHRVTASKLLGRSKIKAKYWKDENKRSKS